MGKTVDLKIGHPEPNRVKESWLSLEYFDAPSGTGVMVVENLLCGGKNELFAFFSDGSTARQYIEGPTAFHTKFAHQGVCLADDCMFP